VEFCARGGTPTYAVIPLLAEVSNGRSVATDLWSDIVRTFAGARRERRRMKETVAMGKPSKSIPQCGADIRAEPDRLAPRTLR